MNTNWVSYNSVLTLSTLGNDKGFKTSVPGTRAKDQIYFLLYYSRVSLYLCFVSLSLVKNDFSSSASIKWKAAEQQDTYYNERREPTHKIITYVIGTNVKWDWHKSWWLLGWVPRMLPGKILQPGKGHWRSYTELSGPKRSILGVSVNMTKFLTYIP